MGVAVAVFCRRETSAAMNIHGAMKRDHIPSQQLNI